MSREPDDEEFLTLYDDGETPTWQSRWNFIDANGDVSAALEEFERENPKDNTSAAKKVQATQKRKLSPASQAIFDHTATLANQSVSSSDVSGSTEELKAITKKIKTETKKEIRQAGITQREAQKNEIAQNMKSHFSHQEQSQHLGQLLQMQAMKMMAKMMNEDSDEPQSKQIVELKGEVAQLKGELSEVLSLLRANSNGIRGENRNNNSNNANFSVGMDMDLSC